MSRPRFDELVAAIQQDDQRSRIAALEAKLAEADARTGELEARLVDAEAAVVAAQRNAEEAMNRRLHSWLTTGTAAPDEGANEGPAGYDASQRWRCSTCGAELDDAEVGGLGDHCRTDDDGRGNPVPAQCGPCYLLTATPDEEPR